MSTLVLEYEDEIKLLRNQNAELVFITGKLSDELQEADRLVQEQRKRIAELEQEVKCVLDVVGRCRSM